MAEEVVVDGVSYRWDLEIEEDPNAGSLSFSNRGMDFESKRTVVITGDDGSSIRFELPDDRARDQRWWLGYPNVTPEVVGRAVTIAKQAAATRLHAGQVYRALWGEAAGFNVQTGLNALATALGVLC